MNNEVPEGWKKEYFENLAILQRGFDLPVQARFEGRVPVVASNGIVGCHNEVKISGPGVVTGRSGTIGKVHYFNNDFWPLNTTLYIRDFKGNSPSFVYWILQHIGLQKFATGTGVPTLNRNIVHREIVTIPPLPEQKKIAEILTSVDEAIAATKAVIEQTKQVKKGLLQTLLTKGIGHTKFKQTPLGEFPENWEVCMLDSLCNKITDGSHQSVKTTDSGVPFLYVSGIRNSSIIWDKAGWISEETYQEISRGREPRRGVVLYTAVGSYGHAVALKDDKAFSFQRHIAYLAPKEGELLPEYLEAYLNSPMGRKHADMVAIGNAQKSVTLKELGRFRIPLPSYEEQQVIVQNLKRVSDTLNCSSDHLTQLQTLKKGLMADLLTGRKRVEV